MNQPNYVYSNSLEKMVVKSFYYKNQRYVWNDSDCVYYSDDSDEDWFSEVPEGCSY